jgi:hypothetical protein
MIRKTMLASAFVLTLSLAAFGGRFTDSYDSLESVVQGLQEGLPATLDKSQKKAAKTYKSTLKKLGKDTDSLKKELKLGKTISNKLQKLGDGAVDEALGGAAAAAQADVIAALEAAQQRLNSVAGKVSPAKVQKQIDAGFDAVEASSGQTKLSKRFALLGKAEARARKADKLADKVSGGGGGGGGECLGNDIAQSDTVIVTRDGGDFGTDKVLARTTTTELGTFTQIAFYDCDGKRVLDLSLPSPLTVGSYSGGSIFPETKASFFVGPTGEGFGISTFGGVVNVTSVDGRLQFSFEWDTGAAGSAFDGVYLGSIDIPAIDQ